MGQRPVQNAECIVLSYCFARGETSPRSNLTIKNTCEANIESRRDISIRRNIDPGGNIDIGSAIDIAPLRYIALQFDIR